MRTAGIVLCGGKSSRMGHPKAMLPVGDELMLQRVVRLVATVANPVVVVSAEGQEVPDLPPEVSITQDLQAERGPLAGLQAGLAALGNHADAAYVTSCDVPLLVPGFIERMVQLLEQYQIAVPVDGDFHHPLAAVYRTSVLPLIDRLLEADRLRPVYLFESARTRRVTADELKDVDPQLASLTNLNRPADYLAALKALGVAAPPGVLEE